MKQMRIEPRDGTHLYRAMVKKQDDIRKSGRGTFSRSGAKRRDWARWSHVRYKGSIKLQEGESDAVEVEIKSPDRGDEARLTSSFLGWLDRHFGDRLSSVHIRYGGRRS